MHSVGAFEAKTHLASLLERVARGEEIEITRHGKPVARLVPARPRDDERAAAAVARLRSLRRGATLAGLSWQELRDTGRR